MIVTLTNWRTKLLPGAGQALPGANPSRFTRAERRLTCGKTWKRWRPGWRESGRRSSRPSSISPWPWRRNRTGRRDRNWPPHCGSCGVRWASSAICAAGPRAKRPASMPRSRNPDIKLALVRGLNESCFPALPQAAAVLTEMARAELADRNVILTTDARRLLGRERYYAYIAFTRSRQGLILPCSRQDAAG